VGTRGLLDQTQGADSSSGSSVEVVVERNPVDENSPEHNYTWSVLFDALPMSSWIDYVVSRYDVVVESARVLVSCGEQGGKW
jgi:hypothetical protein